MNAATKQSAATRSHSDLHRQQFYRMVLTQKASPANKQEQAVIRLAAYLNASTHPVMFDDITDEDYAEWKDWFDAGYHNLLAGIVLIVFGLFVVGGVLQEVEADKKLVKPAIRKSVTTTTVLHIGP